MIDKSTVLQSLLLGLALAAAINLIARMPEGEQLGPVVGALIIGTLVFGYLAGLTHGLTARWKVSQKMNKTNEAKAFARGYRSGSELSDDRR